MITAPKFELVITLRNGKKVIFPATTTDAHDEFDDRLQDELSKRMDDTDHAAHGTIRAR